MKLSLQMIDQIGENTRKSKEEKIILTLSIFCLATVVILTAIVQQG